MRIKKPTQYALIISGLYVLFCTAYIILSSHWAAQISDSKMEQEIIERYKGLAFVILSGILLLGLSRYFMMRQDQLHKELIQKQEDLQISERKFLAGSLANTLAHDANHLLGSMGFRLENLKRQLVEPRFHADIVSIEASMTKMATLFKKIQLNHRKLLDIEKLEECDLFLSLEKNVELIQSHLLYERVEFKILGDRNLPKCLANCGIFEHMAYNLILNATQSAVENSAQPQVSVLLESTLAGFALEIHDNGPGIPEPLRDKVTKPYFSTKPNGAGLGFQTVHSFLQSQIGQFTIGQSDFLGGAKIRVEFSQKNQNPPSLSEITQ